MNFIPGIYIPEKAFRLSLPRLGGGGGGEMNWLAQENRGAMPTGGGMAAPNLGIPAAAISGATGGAGGRGGGSQTAAPSFAPPTLPAAVDLGAGLYNLDLINSGVLEGARPIVVNVNGGLGTSAEIGAAVVDAIRQYNNVNGPAPIAVV